MSTELQRYADPSPPSRLGRAVSEREQETVIGILREFQQYQNARSMHAMQCEETAALILPTSRNTFFFQSYNTPGLKKTQQQVDASGALALHRFCAISDSLVTPRNMQWHGLSCDDYIKKDRDVRLWLEGVTRQLFRMRYAARANFAGQNYANWQSLGAFGNATMYVDKYDDRWHGGGRGLRYKSLPLGETFYGENHQGQVDRMVRWFRLTAYQAVQKWGREWLPDCLVAPLQQDSQWRYNFLHCVRPRADGEYSPDALDYRSMPFSSYYVSYDGRCLMAPESGYRSFPLPASRYAQAPDEVYGRGPAQIVLPALKTLNAQKTVFLKQGHRGADPVLLIADDGLVGMDMRPGAQNKGGVTADGKPLVHTLPTGDIKITLEMMQEERGIIDDTFLVSLFKVLSENPNMTATQVVALVAEKGMLVAPTLGRQHTEFVGSGLVPREIDLLFEMGLLDRPPGRLIEAARGSRRNLLALIEVTDTSPLSKAAQMGEAAGFNQWIENLTKVASEMQDPSWLDVVNSDAAARDLADIYSVRENWKATPDQIAQKRKARAGQQQQQARIAALPGEAAMAQAQAKLAASGQQQPQGAM